MDLIEKWRIKYNVPFGKPPELIEFIKMSDECIMLLSKKTQEIHTIHLLINNKLFINQKLKTEFLV